MCRESWAPVGRQKSSPDESLKIATKPELAERRHKMQFIAVLEKGTEYLLIPTIEWEGYATDETIRRLKDEGRVVLNSFGIEI